MKRSSWLIAALLALILTTSTLLSGSRSAQASPAHGRVVFTGISFYSGKNFHHHGCVPTGPPSIVFSSSVKRIYDLVRYRKWNGRHTDQFYWYAPNGQLYVKDPVGPYTGQGPTTDCSWLDISGFGAAHLPGRWTFRLKIDGQFARQATFTLVRG